MKFVIDSLHSHQVEINDVMDLQNTLRNTLKNRKGSFIGHCVVNFAFLCNNS